MFVSVTIMVSNFPLPPPLSALNLPLCLILLTLMKAGTEYVQVFYIYTQFSNWIGHNLSPMKYEHNF